MDPRHLAMSGRVCPEVMQWTSVTDSADVFLGQLAVMPWEPPWSFAPEELSLLSRTWWEGDHFG
jgi:hypothetical protein